MKETMVPYARHKGRCEMLLVVSAVAILVFLASDVLRSFDFSLDEWCWDDVDIGQIFVQFVGYRLVAKIE